MVWKRCSLSMISEGWWGKNREERVRQLRWGLGAESTGFNKTGLRFQQRKTLADKDRAHSRKPTIISHNLQEHVHAYTDAHILGVLTLDGSRE